MHLLQSFYIARIVSGLICVILSALALRICQPAGRLWLIFCLCLPEVMSLYASFSPDGPFFATLALACALLTKCSSDQESNLKKNIFISTLLLSLCVCYKPPYLSLLLIPLLIIPFEYFLYTISNIIFGMFLLFLWTLFGVHPVISPTRGGDISASRQLLNLYHHPDLIPTIIHNTFIKDGAWLVETTISTTSWVDAGMPHTFYYFMLALLISLFCLYFYTFIKNNSKKDILKGAFLYLLLAIAGFGATLSTYLTWDEVGRDSVWGVLGRYFTPLLIGLTAGTSFLKFNSIIKRATLFLQPIFLYGLLPLCALLYLRTIYFRFW